jgi:DnaJ family protein A protein 5
MLSAVSCGQIDELDVEGGDGSRTDAAPGLGSTNTSMDDVNDFYQHWKSYTTQRSFAWVDEYKTTDAPTRMVRRAMEKENKKLRDAAKKAFTTEVRELVDFVCRRDPRVQAIQKQKEREKERRRVEDEAKRRDKQAAYDTEKRAFQEQQEKLWADSETSRVADKHIEQELEKLRKKMDADVLVCDLCSKTFKSTKQLQNHLTSRKHREKEQELGVFSDLSGLDDEMDRALQEELLALGKAKREVSDEDDAPSKQSEEDGQKDAAEVDPQQQQADEEAAQKKAEAERVRLEKEEKAAEKRRERKEMRKNKKKESVEKIVSSARSKKEKTEEEEEQRGRGKKGKKRR